MLLVVEVLSAASEEVIEPPPEAASSSSPEVLLSRGVFSSGLSLEAFFAVAIVDLPLLVVFQHLVGIDYLGKLVLGLFFVISVFIRM